MYKFIAVLLTLYAVTGLAVGDAIRCGSKIMKAGITSEEVLKYCKNPSRKEVEEHDVRSGNRVTDTTQLNPGFTIAVLPANPSHSSLIRTSCFTANVRIRNSRDLIQQLHTRTFAVPIKKPAGSRRVFYFVTTARMETNSCGSALTDHGSSIGITYRSSSVQTG
jgi:hypothetical protein